MSDLDSVDLSTIDVDRDCKPSPALDHIVRLLAGALPREGGSPLAGGATEHDLLFPQGMSWRGLTLRAVGTLTGIESGPANFSLYVEEPAEVLRSRLNADGFDLPSPGEDRGIDGSLSIGVETTPNGSVLTCYFD